MSLQKQKPIISKKLRALAEGQDCTLRLAGVCNYDTETTVLAHLPDESNGMGRKPDDISACFACSSCHDYIDGRVKANRIDPDFADSQHDLMLMRRAQTRTMRIAIEAGVLILK